MESSDNSNSQPAYSMVKVIKYLNEMGYKMNPTVRDGELVCMQTEEKFAPEQLALVGSFRFEEISDPEDLSIVYAIQANNGARALLVDAYGPYADPDVAEFINNIKDERWNNSLMECVPPQKTIVISSN